MARSSSGQSSRHVNEKAACGLSLCLSTFLLFRSDSPPTPSRKYYPIPMPLSKPGEDPAAALLFPSLSFHHFHPVTVLSACLIFSFMSRLHWILFSSLFDPFPTIRNPLIRLPTPSDLPRRRRSIVHFGAPFAPPPQTTTTTTPTSDHTRKIELVRYLMSGYMNGKVLDTLSEHANALASSAVASLEDEADQLSHFLFLPLPGDLVLTVPRHDGWYSRTFIAPPV